MLAMIGANIAEPKWDLQSDGSYKVHEPVTVPPPAARAAAPAGSSRYDLCDPIKDAKQRELCRGHPDPLAASPTAPGSPCVTTGAGTRICTGASEPEPPSWGEVTLVEKFAYIVEYGVVHGRYFTLRNDNPFAVKDVPVTCTLTARSGTVLGYLTPTVFEVIPAHGSLEVKDLALGIQPPQSYGVQCVAGRSDRVN
jgi:hypothetical protein